MSGPATAVWQERFETHATPWDRGGPGHNPAQVDHSQQYSGSIEASMDCNRWPERCKALPAQVDVAHLISFPTPAVAGQAFAKKQVLQYNVSGSAEMTDLPLVRACASLCEPVNQHGPGIVGDSGERSNAHPV